MQSCFTGKICRTVPDERLLLRNSAYPVRPLPLTSPNNSRIVFLHCDCLARCHDECPDQTNRRHGKPISESRRRCSSCVSCDCACASDAVAAIAAFADAKTTTVAIVDSIAAPQSQYAARKLGAALAERGYTLQASRAGADLTITLTIESQGAGRRILFHRPQGPRHHDCRRRPPRAHLRRARVARTIAERNSPREDAACAREARARLPRYQVQHALGYLPAELGAGPALRHGARPRVLGSLARHDGREPLQRVHVVDDASVHLHDPARKLP